MECKTGHGSFRFPLALAGFMALLMGFVVLVGASGTSAEGPQSLSTEISAVDGEFGWGMPPTSTQTTVEPSPIPGRASEPPASDEDPGEAENSVDFGDDVLNEERPELP